MTSKFSRAALIAGLAVGAGGLVAVPAEAAGISAGISTANYYVNQPAVTGATDITPESAVLTGAVDTGGNPVSMLAVPSALTWDGSITISSGAKWAGDTTGATVPVDGLPVSGSNNSVSVVINDATLGNSGAYQFISNQGDDNYSTVGFDYDPVSDYVANRDSPGDQTQYAQEVDVPTTTGISAVKVAIGAFGQAAQNNSGNAPLKPGTKYVYWIVQQPGATDGLDINIAGWFNGTGSNPQPTGTALDANPTYKCYPKAAIEADPTLAGYLASYNASTGTSETITTNGTSAPAIQGPCVYYYGNTSGAIYYDSPTGTFTTPKLGRVAFGAHAKVVGHRAMVPVSVQSGFRAAGSVVLKIGGRTIGTGRFSLPAHASGRLIVKLNGAGVKAAMKHRTARLVTTSNWDQPTKGRSVRL